MKFGASVFLRLAALFAFGLTAASGTTLYSNIGISPTSYDTIANDLWYAQSFTMGSGDDPYLQTLKLVLAKYGNSVGSVNVDLWSSNGTPGPASFIANIGTLDETNLTLTAATFSFTPSSLITLTDATRYWIVVSDTVSGSTFNWITATSGSGTKVTGEYTATYSSGWFTFVGGTANGTPMMEVFTVPEPSTLVISGLGLAALALRRRIIR